MLGKLLKYEFKASSRLFLLLYAALVVVTIINTILLRVGDSLNDANWIYNVAQGIVMFSYVILIIAVAAATIIMIIIRFYRNLLGDEGYLMFTLPVNTDSHILSRLISSVLWCIASTIVVLGSLVLLTSHLGVIGAIGDFIEYVSSMGINVGGWTVVLILAFIVYLMNITLMFYAAMAIGSNLTKHRLLGSFLGYIIVYAIGQAIGLLSLGFLYVSGMWDKLISYGNEAVPADQMTDMLSSIGSMFMVYMFVLQLIMLAIYYFITRYFIKNKLNLS